MSDRTRALRYKRPALASMGAYNIMAELDDIVEACNGVRYYIEQADNDETLLNALDGDADCIVHLGEAAIDLIERLTAANAELREKRRWIPVTERLPEERALVNVVWVNRAPEPYYKKIKGVPFSGTACFYRGRWYWDSPVVLDLLAEYGEDEIDLVDEAVEVTHWMPLPEAPKFADVLRGAPEAPGEGGKADA